MLTGAKDGPPLPRLCVPAKQHPAAAAAATPPAAAAAAVDVAPQGAGSACCSHAGQGGHSHPSTNGMMWSGQDVSAALDRLDSQVRVCVCVLVCVCECVCLCVCL